MWQIQDIILSPLFVSKKKGRVPRSSYKTCLWIQTCGRSLTIKWPDSQYRKPSINNVRQWCLTYLVYIYPDISFIRTPYWIPNTFKLILRCYRYLHDSTIQSALKIWMIYMFGYMNKMFYTYTCTRLIMLLIKCLI